MHLLHSHPLNQLSRYVSVKTSFFTLFFSFFNILFINDWYVLWFNSSIYHFDRQIYLYFGSFITSWHNIDFYRERKNSWQNPSSSLNTFDRMIIRRFENFHINDILLRLKTPTTTDNFMRTSKISKYLFAISKSQSQFE